MQSTEKECSVVNVTQLVLTLQLHVQTVSLLSCGCERCEVLTVVSMKIAIFWDVTPCSFVVGYQTMYCVISQKTTIYDYELEEHLVAL